MSLGVSSCHPFTRLAHLVYRAPMLSDADWLAREQGRAVKAGFPPLVTDPVALGVVAATLSAHQSRPSAPESHADAQPGQPAA